MKLAMRYALAAASAVAVAASLLAPRPAAAQISPNMGPYLGPIPPVYRYVDPPGPGGYMRAPRHTHRHDAQDAAAKPPESGEHDAAKASENDAGDQVQSRTSTK